MSRTPLLLWMLVYLLLALLALTGCASAADLVKALAADPASMCIEAKAVLYGTLRICRTNAAGVADLSVSDQGLRLQHRGKRGE